MSLLTVETRQDMTKFLLPNTHHGKQINEEIILYLTKSLLIFEI